jgi:uncharacterized protein YbaP (TraB family)
MALLTLPRFLVAGLLSVLVVLLQQAHADTPAALIAHPALWTVHGKAGTVYLLGSLHLLPPNVTWRTSQIDTAMAASDAFLFEAPTDQGGQDAVRAFIAAHGLLPKGETLSHTLPPGVMDDYNYALAKSHVPPAVLEDKQPWVAALILQVGIMMQEHYDPSAGIDKQVFAYAAGHGRNVRYFETVEQQLALLAPADDALAMTEFAVTLHEIRTEPDTIGPLVDAWSRADEDAINRLMNSDLAKDPAAHAALLDNRNKAWIGKIETMLGEKHTFFVTVGAAHLAGPGGVPALLRAKGYKVDGP